MYEGLREKIRESVGLVVVTFYDHTQRSIVVEVRRHGTLLKRERIPERAIVESHFTGYVEQESRRLGNGVMEDFLAKLDWEEFYGSGS